MCDEISYCSDIRNNIINEYVWNTKMMFSISHGFQSSNANLNGSMRNCQYLRKGIDAKISVGVQGNYVHIDIVASVDRLTFAIMVITLLSSHYMHFKTLLVGSVSVH